MAKKMCKCAICGIEFDRNAIQAVRHGARRYSHQTCEPNNTDLVPMEGGANDPELKKLKDYISTLFGENANWAMINKQIKKYKEENGYSYSGILKSLVYFYDVKHNSKEKANNAISIVPYVYQDAYNYYYSLFLAQQATQDKTLITKVKEIIIKPPKMRGTKQQFFDLGEWENEE